MEEELEEKMKTIMRNGIPMSRSNNRRKKSGGFSGSWFNSFSRNVSSNTAHHRPVVGICVRLAMRSISTDITTYRSHSRSYMSCYSLGII